MEFASSASLRMNLTSASAEKCNHEDSKTQSHMHT